MPNAPLLVAASKLGAATVPVLLGVGLVAVVLAMAAVVLRAAAGEGEARSRGEVAGRLRALDEVAAMGGMGPDEYAARRTDLLNEI